MSSTIRTEQRRHLVEREPDGVLLEPDVHADLPVSGLVDDDFAARGVGGWGQGVNRSGWGFGEERR